MTRKKTLAEKATDFDWPPVKPRSIELKLTRKDAINLRRCLDMMPDGGLTEGCWPELYKCKRRILNKLKRAGVK